MTLVINFAPQKNKILNKNHVGVNPGGGPKIDLTVTLTYACDLYCKRIAETEIVSVPMFHNRGT
jgi:hypothetical protein